MKTPSAERVSIGSKSSKSKRQAFLLGGLLVVLVVVLVIQFSEADDAMAATAPSFAKASEGLQQSTMRVDDAESMVTAPDNMVLSEESTDNSVMNSPFVNFWNVNEPSAVPVEDIPAPSITLNGTLTSGRRPVAVIDGQTRFINDMVQGWRLVSIGSREIVLESGDQKVITVEMPLLKLSSRITP
jgi:hypothetical protein